MNDGQDGDDKSDKDERRPDLESLRLSHQEARTVLDHQIQIQNDIDDKALRTVRITALIAGLLISAGSLSEDPTQFLRASTLLGAGLLFGSLVAGVVTYTAASPTLGPGSRYFKDRLPDRTDEYDTLSMLLSYYSGWIESNDDLNRINGAYLAIAQTLLICGLVSLGVGILLSL